MKQSGRIILCIVSILLLAFTAAVMISCGGSSSSPPANNGPTTANFVGTQSPGDYWTWVETTSSSPVTFTATNTVTGYTYSGSETALTGNSSGITQLTVTSSTDPNNPASVTAPVTAYEIEVPNTMVIAAVPPFATVNQPQATIVSEHGPVVAAAQGSCPANGTTTNVDWIVMPTAGWCPTANATYIPTTQAGATCTAANDAFGTATVAVDASGNYTVSATAYYLNGTKDTSASAPTFSQCSCSSGVIECTDNNSKPVKIAFTPSGIFIMDTANNGVAGVVQSNITTANFSSFYANGNTYKGMSFWSFDDPNGWPGIPETAPASLTTDGVHLTYQQYANIAAGTLSTNTAVSVPFNNATEVAPGLITTTFTNCDGSTSPMAIALTQINGKYVAFALGYSPGQGPGNGGNCPDYTHGFNVLAVQQ